MHEVAEHFCNAAFESDFNWISKIAFFQRTSTMLILVVHLMDNATPTVDVYILLDVMQKIDQVSSPAAFLTWSLDMRQHYPSEIRRKFEQYYKNYLGYFGHRSQIRYNRQFVEILDYLGDRPSARVLEVGCGCGSESLYFGLVGAEVTAIDVSPKRLAVAAFRKKFVEKNLQLTANTEFKNQNILDITKKESFDALWLEQAFHHCEPRGEVVAAIAQLLKPVGRVFISEANPWHPLISLGLFLKRGTKTIKTYLDEDGNERQYGNERIITKSGLAKNLADVGIKEEHFRYFNVFPNWRIFDGLAQHEESYPKIACLHSHYNFVGIKS